ncbi:chemotaxis protein CheA [Desulfobacter latus]|uniref:Chemotaxis protein CheA n=1 Tax=Desulfobacter latus TaxID=2292 RepID=A0A850T6X9_9BACT|nr:chemotaxis protein CheA [Desulfobacter latus]NWH05152.1 chemotaxis protein CheA [Desulfobacter latus]
MDTSLEAIRKEFYLEAGELLEKAGDDILKAESALETSAYLNAIFRDVHTIKGGAGMLEMNAISTFCHKLEGLLNMLRDGSCMLSPELVDLILAGLDHITFLMNEYAESGKGIIDQNLVEQFEDAVSGGLSVPVPGKKQFRMFTGAALEMAVDLADYCAQVVDNLSDQITTFKTIGSSQSLEVAARFAGELKKGGKFIGLDLVFHWGSALESFCLWIADGQSRDDGQAIALLETAVTQLKQTFVLMRKNKTPADLPKVYSDIQGMMAGEQLADEDISEDDVYQEAVANLMMQKGLLSELAEDIPLDEIQQAALSALLDNMSGPVRELGLADMHAWINDAVIALAQEDDSTLSEKLSAIISTLDDLQEPPRRIGEILVAEGKISPTDIHDSLARQKPIGQMLVEAGKVKMTDVKQAVSKQKLAAAASQVQEVPDVAAIKTETLRIDQAKVEQITNMIGEMTILRNTYEFIMDQYHGNHLSAEKAMNAFHNEVQIFSRLAEDLQHGVFSLRMIPIGGVFQKFSRVVRDISRKQSKQIEFLTYGDDVEIDKKIADVLSDPLVHLLRNACDHGIETPGDRIRSGKAEKGTVSLKASQEGNNLRIVIADDGRGIDRERLFEKAKAKGFEYASKDDPDLLDVIFSPGFSTNSQVTDISGRGVGMDVVKTNIESMGGSAGLESDQGSGTRVILSIPMTMGISTALIVMSQGNPYAIPFDSILNTIKVLPDAIKENQGTMFFNYRDEILPVRHLEAILSSGKNGWLKQVKSSQDEVTIVVVKTGQSKFGVVVDQMDRKMEVAIKPLPGMFQGLDVFSGVSIMGDGKVLLVLNPELFIAA